ncbi:TetR/AcrR family transcriptional regulator [Desmospora profundinema]|uniref:AcrR family transcriptional regulator n=1 Tax=Desmospora profundinema TaxID=1571184 RepID=A0ABU1IP24_9BACL|nr:TetR/AcrR family transcriptional regulator [Desmospora profundinema]MDR6226549.1 AcrR family transcriptional regulator [Desmospora profundinema]
MKPLLFMTEMPKDAQEKMLFVALNLFTSKGFKETSILEVVEQARVSKTTFYNHFNSKEELLVSLFKQLAEEIIEEVEQAVYKEERMAYKAFAGIHRYIEICLTRISIAQLLLVSSVGVSQAVEEVRRDVHKRFADLFYGTVRTGLSETVTDEEMKIVAQAMVGAINEVVIQKLFESEKEIELDRLARLLNRVVVGAFANLITKNTTVHI